MSKCSCRGLVESQEVPNPQGGDRHVDTDTAHHNQVLDVLWVDYNAEIQEYTSNSILDSKIALKGCVHRGGLPGGMFDANGAVATMLRRTRVTQPPPAAFLILSDLKV